MTIGFDYVKPDSLAQLIDGLRQANGEGAILAGGTDLLVKIRSGAARPRVVFDVGGLGPCRAITVADDVLKIGAAVTMSEIIASPLVRGHVPALATAAGQMSATQIRNRATIAGNIVTASPAADGVPPLLAAGARLALVGPDGRREMALGDFLLGPGKTALKPGEAVIEVLVPRPSGDWRSGFIKVGRRKAMAISIVNLAGSLRVNGNGIIDEARLVLGSVAPTAIRAPNAEAALRGQRPTKAVIAEAARLAGQDARPISDVRGSEKGRRLLIEAWTGRLLTTLVGPVAS